MILETELVLRLRPGQLGCLGGMILESMERKGTVRGFNVQGYRRKKFHNRSFSAASRFDK